MLSAVRFSPVLHVGIALAATALMFLSSAAALCSCVLCFQTVAVFWADAGGGGAAPPRRHSGIPTAEVLLAAASREGSAGGSDGGSEGVAAGAERRSADGARFDEVHSVASGARLTAMHAPPLRGKV